MKKHYTIKLKADDQIILGGSVAGDTHEVSGQDDFKVFKVYSNDSLVYWYTFYKSIEIEETLNGYDITIEI